MTVQPLSDPVEIIKTRASLWNEPAPEQPSEVRRIGKKFLNPWATWKSLSFSRMLRYVATKNTPNPPSPEQMVLLTGNARYEDTAGHQLCATDGTADISFVWLGHAACLVRVNGITILTDPVFTEKCSPVSFIGPSRLQPLCFGERSLPHIDIVLVSHDHHDHCCPSSIKELFEAQDVPPVFIAGLGMAPCIKSRLGSVGATASIHELDWYQSSTIGLSGARTLDVTFTPAQHWAGRYLTDRDTRLWGSFIIAAGGKSKVFFAGDTGYCAEFKLLGDRYGPIDLALIPIGACAPREVMMYQHIDPYDAVQVHKDLRAKQSFGIHWGTWILSNEPVAYPKEALTEAVKHMIVGDDDKISFSTIPLGVVQRISNPII